MTSCVKLLTDLVDWGLPVLAGLTLSVFMRVHTTQQFSGLEIHLWVSKHTPLVISLPPPWSLKTIREQFLVPCFILVCQEDACVLGDAPGNLRIVGCLCPRQCILDDRSVPHQHSKRRKMDTSLLHCAEGASTHECSPREQLPLASCW